MKTDKNASTSAPTWSLGWINMGITCRWNTNTTWANVMRQNFTIKVKVYPIMPSCCEWMLTYTVFIMYSPVLLHWIKQCIYNTYTCTVGVYVDRGRWKFTNLNLCPLTFAAVFPAHRWTAFCDSTKVAASLKIEGCYVYTDSAPSGAQLVSYVRYLLAIFIWLVFLQFRVNPHNFIVNYST